ncbi:MAG: GIY-YIG nuclease family protein [Candidatus Doudnabacteria bacterium]|nr:GIY-YIG nuclease family protein [Candidatus Doudnabacteria bacterium]
MFHFVYKITNTLDAKYYIGVHSTSNIDDGYMGSGSHLKYAIAKYGAEKFEREILHSFETRKEALSKEEELVTFETLADPLCYNLILGGVNGVQTTKEKRELFSTFALPARIRQVIPFDPEARYEAKLKYRVKTHPDLKGGNAFWNIFTSNAILDIITGLYNDKAQHALALKYIDLLHRIVAFRGNFYMDKIPTIA